MWMPASQLQQQVINPSLNCLGLDCDGLSDTLTAIAACPKPEASEVSFGLYGMTHEQHWLLWDSYLVHSPILASNIRGLASQHQFLQDPDQELNGNFSYATAIAAYWLQMHCTTPTTQTNPEILMSLWYQNASRWQPSDYRHLVDTYQRLNGKNRENVA